MTATAEDVKQIVGMVEGALLDEVEAGCKEVSGRAMMFDTKTMVSAIAPFVFDFGKDLYFKGIGMLWSQTSTAEDTVFGIITEGWGAEFADRSEAKKFEESDKHVHDLNKRIEVVMINVGTKDSVSSILYDLERKENGDIFLINRKEKLEGVESKLFDIFFSQLK